MKRIHTIAGSLAILLLATTAHATADGNVPDRGPAAHLAASPSPYLREHADNLVAWRTWGPEAFEEARRSGKPIFLSIGYMACHWCHVMEEKNFMNPRIAAFINRHFIPVLVDRERRPGVDETYMLATQVLTGSGGWPNNLFLTPDLEPFFAGVYFPPSRFARILRTVEKAWREDRASVEKEAARVASILRAFLTRRQTARMLTPQKFDELADAMAAEFDEFHGGLGSGPKHFRTPVLMMLARAALLDGDRKTREALLVTLETVIRAGVMDQLAGGFHRYAVDARWNLPHFEKMLHTQAGMTEALLAGWQITGRRPFADAARRTLDYVLADLTAPSGGFFSARDADSEGAEGTYYVWTPEQLKQVLGAEDARFAMETFGTVLHGELAGRVIPNLLDAKPSDMLRVRRILKRLLKAREKRVPPRRDEKITTAWNGLMISAFARAAIMLDEPRYGKAARRAALFVLENLRDGKGNLLRSWFDGAAHLPATLDDHAYLIRALLDLHDMDDDPAWLEEALALARRTDALFRDDADGTYWFTRTHDGFARPKLVSDSALPAAQAVLLASFARLAVRTGNEAWRRKAEQLASALLAPAYRRPIPHAATLTATDLMLRGETGPVRHAAGGVVRVHVKVRATGQGTSSITAEMRLRPGWHVNAARPGDENLIPTRLEDINPRKPLITGVRYPGPAMRRLRFAGREIPVLEGRFRITATGRTSGAPLRMRLTFQPCSDEICLQPQSLEIGLPAVPPSWTRTGSTSEPDR